MAIEVRGSDELKSFIKEAEGFSPKPYDDLGVPAIGYGQRGFDPNVTEVTEEQASVMLNDHLSKIEKEVANKIKRTDLTQSQMDAILDAAYNFGVPKLEQEYDFFNRVNKGDNEDIKNFFATANKARVNGKLQVLPSLKKRSDKRVEWWSKPITSPSGSAEADILDAIGNLDADGDTVTEPNPAGDLVGGPNPQIGNVTQDIDDAISFGGVEGADNVKTGAGIEIAADTADFKDFDYVNVANRLSREIGVTQEQAEGMLLDDDYDNIVVKHKAKEIANNFPSTTAFMSNSENYPLIARDLEGAKKIEVAAREYKKKDIYDDLETAFNKNAVTTERYLSILKTAIGAQTPEEFSKEYAELNKETSPEYLYRKSIDAYLKSSELSSKKITAQLDKFNKALEEHRRNPGEPGQENVEAVKELLKLGYVGAEAIVDKVIAAAENPEGFAIVNTESLSGTISGWVGMALGGTVGLFTPVPGGAGAGATTGAALSTGVVSYAEKIDDEIRKKTEEMAGKNFNLAQWMRTPEFKEIHEAALIYAGIQGSWEAVTTKMLGKIGKFGKTSRVANKVKPVRASIINSLGKKAVQVPVNLAKEGAAQAGGEAAQQLTSTMASNIYLGRTDSSDLADAWVEAIDEALGTFGPGGIAGSSVGYSMYLAGKTAEIAPGVKDKATSTARKVAPMLKESYRSLRDYERVSRVKEAVKNFKVGDSKGKLRQFIKETLKRDRNEIPPIPARDENNVNIDPSENDVTKESISEQAMKEETATIDSALFARYVTQRGLNPDEIMLQVGDAEYKQYKDSKPGQSITIPLDAWIEVTADIPEISGLARFNDNEFTALEGEDVAFYVQENPVQALMPQKVELESRPDKGDLPPPIPSDVPPPVPGQEPTLKEEGETGEEGQTEQPNPELPPTLPPDVRVGAEPTFEQLQREGGLEEPVLRRVELTSGFKNQDEREVFKKIRAQFRAAVNKKFIPQEMSDFLAEIQYNHVKNRAQVLGKELKEVADENYITTLTEQEELTRPGLGGYFSRTPGRAVMSYIAYRKSKTNVGRNIRANTVIHELGHLWLHEMAIDWDYIHNIPEAQLTKAQKEYKFAMDALAEEYGTKFREYFDKIPESTLTKKQKEFKNLLDKDKEKYGMDTLKPLSNLYFDTADDSIQKEILKTIHESWAQTTERYVLEGKFKNSKLRRVLETMRKYFVRFQEAIGKTYPQYPPLEIDARMERIMEAVTGASNKIDTISYPMFPNAQFDPKIFGVDGEEIVKSIEDAYDEQIGEVYSKIFNQSIKEREETIDQFLDAAQEEAEQNLADKPFAILNKAMREAYQEFKRNGGTDPRISFDSIVEVLFDGDEKMATEWKKQFSIEFIGGKKKKTSTTAYQVMESMGINDSNEFMKLMEDANNYEFFFEREANKVLNRMNPILKSDEEIHEETLNVMANFEKDRYMRKTLSIMAEKAKPQLNKLIKTGALPADYISKRLDKKFVEMEALEYIGKFKYTQLSPKNLLKESDKAGKKAADRLGKKQYLDAFDAKVEQAIKYKAFQMSFQLKRDMQRTELRVRAISRRSPKVLAKRFDIDILKYVMKTYSMTMGSKEGLHSATNIPEFSGDYTINSDLLNPEQVDSINLLRKKWLDSLGSKHPKDASVSDMVDFFNFINGVINISKELKSLRVLGINANATDTAIRTAELIGFKKKGDENVVKDMMAKNYLNGESFLQAIMGNENYFNSDLQKGVKKFMNDSSTTEFEFNSARQRIMESIRKVSKVDSNYKNSEGWLKGLNPLPKKPKEIKLKSGLVLKNGIHDVLVAIFNMGSESNIEKLARGGFGKDGVQILTVDDYDFDSGTWDLSRVMDDFQDLADRGILKKEHFDLAQTVWDEFAKIYPRSKKAIKAVDGYDIGEVQALKLKTPFGEYEGGYYPIVYSNRNINENPDIPSNDFSPTNDGVNVKSFYPAQNKGFENTRTNFYNPLSSDVSLLTYHLQTQYRVAYLRESAYSLGKILGSPVLEEAVENRVPRANKELLKKWYDRVLAQQHTDYQGADVIDATAGWARRSFNIAIFMFNQWSVAKQYIGLVPAARIAGSGRLSSTFLKFTTSRKKYLDAVNRIEDLSPFMKNRRKEYAKSMIRGFERIKLGETWFDMAEDAAQKVSFHFMQMAQNHVDTAVWDAVYEREMEKGTDLKKAVALADDAVKKSQGSTAIEDLSNFQFGGNVKKLFSQFATPAMGQAQQILINEFELRGYKLSDRAKKMMPILIASSLIPGMLLGAIGTIRFGEEEDDFATDMAKGAVRETLGNITPFLGQNIADLLMEGRPISPSPTLDFLSRNMTTARKGISNMTKGVEMSDREFKAVMTAATMFTRVPFVAFAKLDEFLDFLFEGEGEKKAKEKRRRRKLNYLRKIENRRKGRR